MFEFLIDLKSFIRSVLFCFRYLPLSLAVKVPIKLGKNVKVEKLCRGQLKFNKVFGRYQIILGDLGSPALQCFDTTLYVDDGASIIFNGFAIIAEGTSIRADHLSVIEFGDNFYCNKNCYFRSSNRIKFGDNNLLGWNITMNTTDGHSVYINGVLKQNSGPILIGDNVWVSSFCVLGKGVEIADGCVISQGSIVTKKISSCHTLVGGVPAKVISYNVDWKR